MVQILLWVRKKDKKEAGTTIPAVVSTPCICRIHRLAKQPDIHVMHA